MRAQSCIHKPFTFQGASLQSRCRGPFKIMPRRNKTRASAAKDQHSFLTKWAYDAGLKTSGVTLEDFTGDR